MSPVIDILIPVLGRPDNAQKVVDSIHAATKVPHTCVFLCTRGDRLQIAAAKHTKVPVFLIAEEGYAPKINQGVEQTADLFKRTEDDFVFMGADDIHFHPGWDLAAISEFEKSGKPVIGTNDLGNPAVIAGRHATHHLVHRSYHGTIDDPTKLVHEGYFHNWVDNEFIETAQSRDAWTFAADSIVEHLHPFWGKGADDVIYEKGREGYHYDRREFQRRRKLWKRRR